MRYRPTLLGTAICLLLLGGCTAPTAEQPAPKEPDVALVEVPELTNQKYRRVKQVIRRADLEIGKLEREGTGTAGVVLDQDPSPGTEVPSGTPINLVVSKVFPAPLLNVPDIGTFAWTCRRRSTTITFTVDSGAASTRVGYPERSGNRRTRLIHPARSVTAVLTKSQRWTLAQATEPRTLRAIVSIEPPPTCLAYVPPATTLDLRGDSHSTS